jgi:hypothetical protein
LPRSLWPRSSRSTSAHLLGAASPSQSSDGCCSGSRGPRFVRLPGRPRRDCRPHVTSGDERETTGEWVPVQRSRPMIPWPQSTGRGRRAGPGSDRSLGLGPTAKDDLVGPPRFNEHVKQALYDGCLFSSSQFVEFASSQPIIVGEAELGFPRRTPSGIVHHEIYSGL